MDLLLQNCVLAAQRYYSFPGDIAITSLLEGKIDELISQTQDPRVAGRLSKENLTLVDLLGLCTQFISSAKVSQDLRASIQTLFYNIAWYNIPLRGYLAGELQLCTSIYESLRISLRDQLGPKSLADCLQLLQILTYDSTVTLGASWSGDLLKFLVKEIINNGETDMEWIPFCVGILNNLCTHFATVREQIRKHEKVNSMYKKLLSLLKSESTAVVVYSLSLISYLEERLRDKVYDSRNLTQTFQCLFNVLIMGDSFMARHTAVDLFIRLVVDKNDNIAGRFGHFKSTLRIRKQSISHTGQSLLKFVHLESSLKATAGLLVSLDWQREQVSKIYDLLLVFCSIENLKELTCKAVMESGPVEATRLVTPMLAMVEISQPSPQESFIPEVPLKATKLLRLVLEEVVNSNGRIQDYLHVESLLSLVEASVKTPVETGQPQVTYQCRRIVEGLALAKVISLDDDMRTDLLDVVTASLCAHIAEFQMLTNPVSTVLGKARATGDPVHLESLPPWSPAGVEIVLELLQVIAELKNHSGYHKQQYWKLLKDERLVPFLAYGMTCAETELVRGALQLILHCSQIQNFPFDWLSELIAQAAKAAAKLKRRKVSSISSSSTGPSGEGDTPMDISLNGSGIALNGANLIAGLSKDAARDLDILIGKMKEGLDVRDVNLADVFEAFERKCASHEAKERSLQEMLDTKQALLQQSERLVAQYRSQRGETDQEVKKLRVVAQEYEKNCHKQRQDGLHSEQRIQALTEEVDNVSKDLESEKKLCESYRQRHLDIKEKFELTSKKLFAAEERINELDTQKAKLETVLGDREEEIVRYERATEKFQDSLQRLEEEKKALKRQVAEKIEDAEKWKQKNRSLEADLSKQKELVEAIKTMMAKS